MFIVMKGKHTNGCEDKYFPEDYRHKLDTLKQSYLNNYFLTATINERVIMSFKTNLNRTCYPKKERNVGYKEKMSAS